MFSFSATTRIAVSLACLTVSLVTTARLFGLVPDERKAITRGRGVFCETIAVHTSLLLIKDDIGSLRTTLPLLADRDPNVLSIGLRRNGELLIDSGKHREHWSPTADQKSTETHMLVPLQRENQLWGHVEIAFRPIIASTSAPLIAYPLLSLIVYVAVFAFVLFYFYLRMVLRQLNPSKVVPGRVREALDTLAEGLLIMDQSGRIVLANEAFRETVGNDERHLLGMQASELPWTSSTNEAGQTLQSATWERAIAQSESIAGDMYHLGDEGTKRSFIVNSSPILDPKGKSRGALASFEDVTHLEKKKTELSLLVTQLRESDFEIRKKNEELTRLATRDPLTDCLNRRSYFEAFETQWEGASRYGYPLSAIMVDIDHFKLINDNHGHAVGDEVLRQVAASLNSTARESDLVCRYGGEEFAILLPHTSIDEASVAADKFRQAIESLQFPQLTLTASLGVSTTGLGSTDPQTLLDEADRCLYFAKRNGRNQVSRFRLASG